MGKSKELGENLRRTVDLHVGKISSSHNVSTSYLDVSRRRPKISRTAQEPLTGSPLVCHEMETSGLPASLPRVK